MGFHQIHSPGNGMIILCPKRDLNLGPSYCSNHSATTATILSEYCSKDKVCYSYICLNDIWKNNKWNLKWNWNNFLFSNGLQIEELVYSINYEENCGDLKSTFLFKLFIDLVKHFPWTQKLMLDHCVRPYKHKKWLSNLK